MCAKSVSVKPSLTLADFPGYVEANRRLQELRAQESELVSRLNAEETTTERSASITDAAKRWLRGEGSAATVTVDKAAITRELDVVREANAIVEREVHVERGAAAEAIVADRKAEHDRLRRAIVDTACALAEAISTEVEFVDRTSGEIGLNARSWFKAIKFAHMPRLAGAFRGVGEQQIRKFRRDNAAE